jgi:hypothetical protein
MPQTFSVGKRIYSVDMIHAYIQLFEPVVVGMPLDVLEYCMHIKSWNDRGLLSSSFSAQDVLDNPKKYEQDFERIKNANLKYPIIIWNRANGHYVVDGIHRIAKAIGLKRKKINAYIFDEVLMNKFLVDRKGNLKRVEDMPMSETISMFHERFPRT